MPIPVAPPVYDLTGPGTPGAVLHDGLVTLGGVTFGTTDEFGVEWILESLKGWSDAPPTTGATEQRVADHGGWYNTAYFTPRDIELEGSLIATDWAGASQALDRLALATPLNTPDWLYVDEGYRVLQARVRQDGDPLSERRGGWARVNLSLEAADPRRYSSTETVASTGLPQTSGGLSLPITLPLTIGATTNSGRVTVVNEGNEATRPTLTVYGPCPAFTITHIGSGRRIAYPVAVPVGRAVVFDPETQWALLDGTSLQPFSGTFFDLTPGVNEVAFSAASYDPAAQMEVTFRSAWR
jgi:hypothetical protein